MFRTYWLSALSECKALPNKAAKHQGMPQQQLAVITHSIIVSRILYALPAWGGFLTVELKNRINVFLKRLRRFGYINCVMTIDDLIERSDYEHLQKFALEVIPFTICSHRIVEVICACVVIPFSCLIITLICTKVVHCSISV